jgi:hypothetical protein
MRGPALYHTFSHLSIGKIAQKREVNNTSLLVNIPDCWLNLFLSVVGSVKKMFWKKTSLYFYFSHCETRQTITNTSIIKFLTKTLSFLPLVEI